MNFLNEKSKLTVLAVAFLLVAGSFALLPVGAATVQSSASHATPAQASGVTETIDYPIIVGASAPATRTVTVTNPLLSPGITSVTLVTPSGAGAVTATNCNIGQYGPGFTPTCTDQIIGSGSGPYTIIWSLSSGATLVPGGAAVQLSFSITSPATIASGAATTYTLVTSYTPVGTNPTPVQLPSLTLYETLAPTLAFTNYPVSTPSAGSVFSISVTSTVTGLPLAVTGHSLTSNTIAQLTITPGTNGTFTSAASSSLGVNETGSGASTLTLTVAGNGALSTFSTGATITGVPSTAISINPGPLSQVTILLAGSNKIINETSLAVMAGSSITGELTDAYGNAISVAQTITFTASTLSGMAAAFGTSAQVYTATYPYMPTSPALTAQAQCTTVAGTCTLSAYNYFFGVDYGDVSVIHATSGAYSGTSPNVQTFTFATAAPAILSTATNPVKAGGSTTIYIQLPAAVVQAGVPVYLYNTTSPTLGSFTNGPYAVKTTTNTSGIAAATWNVGSAASASQSFGVAVTHATGAGALSNYTGTAAALVTTTFGSVANLQLVAFFQSAGNSGYAVEYNVGSPTSYSYYHTLASASSTNTTVASGLLILDVLATDAYGNPVSVTTDTQITVTTSTGVLSSSTGWIFSGQLDTGTRNYVFGWTAPSTGSTATITATGASLKTASLTITIVSPIPLLNVPNPPTTVVNGVPSIFTGTANASTGYLGNTISSVKFTSTVSGVAGPSGTAALTCGASGVNCAFTFNVLLGASGSNSVNITVTDSQANTFSQVFLVPPVATAHTFTNTSAINLIQFTNGPKAINATYTNNAASSLTVIVVANVLNSQGAIILESTGTITVAAGASGSAFPIIQGVPSGTYTVQVTVYSLAYVTLSPTTSISVTV